MKKILALLNLPENAKESDAVERITALIEANANLKSSNEALKARPVEKINPELEGLDPEVREKIRAGLSKDQALDVVKRQREHDKTLNPAKGK